jgi:hypothetical protein
VLVSVRVYVVQSQPAAVGSVSSVATGVVVLSHFGEAAP